MKLRIATFLAIPVALIAFSATAASAFPKGETPHFRVGEDGKCVLYIDPPIQFPVTFYGTIGGVAFSRVGFYGSAEPHKALVDVTDLMGVGFKHVVVTAKGPFLGVSPTVEFDFQCKPVPVTTTTSTTTSTTVQATTTTTNPCDRFARGVAPNDTRPGAQACSTTTVTPTTLIGRAISAHKELPMTGSSSGPLALFGGSLVVGGLALAMKGRRR